MSIETGTNIFREMWQKTRDFSKNHDSNDFYPWVYLLKN